MFMTFLTKRAIVADESKKLFSSYRGRSHWMKWNHRQLTRLQMFSQLQLIVSTPKRQWFMNFKSTKKRKKERKNVRRVFFFFLFFSHPKSCVPTWRTKKALFIKNYHTGLYRDEKKTRFLFANRREKFFFRIWETLEDLPVDKKNLSGIFESRDSFFCI